MLYRIAALLLAVAALLFTESARAGEVDQPAVLTLILNEAKHGEVIVVLRGSDILVVADDLRDAGLHDLHGRSEIIHGKRHVSLASVSPLRFTFDEGALTLRITAPPELLPTTVIDLRPGAPRDIVERRDTSAFLNYNATLSDLVHPSGFVEGGLSVDGALFSSSASASPEGVVRGLSSLVVDERKNLQRWTLGDSFVTSGALGGGLFMGGLSVSKSFDLDPYLIHQPSLGYTDSVLSPSKLDVYVNGALVRTEPVAPGSFHVQNVPVATGSGDVRYVLRDAFGRERAVASPYSMTASQLAKGESSYTYAIGFARKSMGLASFDYGAPGALGHHRIGLTDKVTMGARLEASFGLLSGGSTLQVLLPVGYAQLAAAASGDPGGAGVAGAATYGLAGRMLGASATVQAMSHRYATLNLNPTDDRNTLEASVMTSVSVGPRLSLTSYSSLVLPRDAPSRFRVGLSVHVELTKNLQLVCMASRLLLGGLSAPAEASALMTYSFDGGITASAGARISREGPQVSAEVNKPMAGATGLGLRASGTAGEHPFGSATAQYSGRYGRYQAAFSVSEGGPHLALEANGALVAIEGAGGFVTTPIQNGFAVIRVPGVKGVHGYLDNRDVGTTDSSGNLLIPNLLPYYGNRLRISDQDLPLDTSIGATEILLSPPLRGGALAVFSAKRVKYYRGRALIEKDGSKIVPSYGEIAVPSEGAGTTTSPIGKDGVFEITDLPTGRSRATITYTGGECVVDVDPPDGAGPVIDLGLLLCAQ